MNLISELLHELDHSSPISIDTAKQVLSMLNSISPEYALFVGDETFTPKLIAEKFVCSLKAAFTDDYRMEQGKDAGLDASAVQLFELPGEDSSYDLIWYNGIVEFDSCVQRLELLRQKLKKGGTLVYRAISWLTDPSPDTKMFCQRRFGQIYPLDKVLVLAKEQGWKIQDFYIAPKTDWSAEYYIPLLAAVERYADTHKGDSTVSLGMSELRREADIFEMHCEEYSCVYYILKG